MDYQEFRGKDVQEAITEACTFYTVASDNLDYEIVENGSAGFLGIGAKQALIRARVKKEEKTDNISESKKSDNTEEKKTEQKKPVEKRSNEQKKTEIEDKNSESKATSTGKKGESRIPSPEQLANIDGEQVKADAEKFLKDVISAMKMDVNIKLEYFAQNGELYVELSGDEMGVLIGKRGQTLDSIQYLTSLVVNKNTQTYVRVKVDTEDYRRRRKETLENLAKNMAYKAKRTKKTVSLEPMNPYERRVIHSALQSDKYVTTHSEGDEPYRRVVINPKKSDRY